MDPIDQRKSRLVKTLLIEISGIGFYWYNKYAGEISEKSLEQKSVTKSRS